MKKILIISLFGLFAAQESSAMLVRATKAASRFAAGLCAGAGIFAGADYVNKMAQAEEVWRNRLDTPWQASPELEAGIEEYVTKRFERRAQVPHWSVSRKEAEKIVAEYDQWAAQYNPEHKKKTDEWRASGVKRFSVTNPFIMYKRECSAQEKEACKKNLMHHGYNTEKAQEICEKIFVMNDDDRAAGAYMASLRDDESMGLRQENIGLSEFVLSGIMQNCTWAVHSLLHEVEHFNHSTGHSLMATAKKDDVNEERRAEIEAMRKMSVIDLEKMDGPEMGRLGFFAMVRKQDVDHFALRKGYVANHKQVRNVIIAEKEKKECDDFVQSCDHAMQAGKRVERAMIEQEVAAIEKMLDSTERA